MILDRASDRDRFFLTRRVRNIRMIHPAQSPIQPQQFHPQTSLRGGMLLIFERLLVKRSTVLHVRVVTSYGGGPDKTIARSAQYANDTPYRIGAAYIHSHRDRAIATLQQNAHHKGCPLWTIGESGPVDPRTLRRLLQLCRAQNVSIWHGHDYKSNLYGLLLRRWWPMKLVTTVHGWTKHTARTRVYYHIDNWCLRHYDHVIVVNHHLVEHCLRHGVRRRTPHPHL